MFRPDLSEVERLLCAPSAPGAIDGVLPRAADAWTTTFPSLASFARYEDAGRPLRVCIATEDIVGPVRNGGIGTTYAALAAMLATAGNDVTILYLRGEDVETESVDHWIGYYAEKGVRFVPVPDYAQADQFRTNADRWLRAPYNMLRYLLEHPADVVHVSEWRGSGYLSLLAKRQGVAFADTLFIVKTSSPWMWNRLYGSHSLERADDLARVTAERQSVELADIVVGGSLHLLRWMASQGYDIPRDRTFVQPNVASFATLQPLIEGHSRPRGGRVPIDEIVFFGRLEARKGLFIFCQAIKRLIRMGVPLPARISFMGKAGARMMSHPGQSTPDYIRSVTADWPTHVEIFTEFQQYEAIEYLLGGARLAVMPSIIENSSMAIYEAAICGIPCVASDVGGNAELIHEDDRDGVLCRPHPIALGDKLEEAIRHGGMVPRPSFDNDDNLTTWRRFHRQLGGTLCKDLLAACPTPLSGGASPLVTVCIYYTGDEDALVATLASLAQQDRPPDEVLVAADTEDNDFVRRAAELLAAHGFPPRAVAAFDFDVGASFNMLAGEAGGDYLLFLWEGAEMAPPALGALANIAVSRGAAVLSYLHRVRDTATQTPSALLASIIGSTSESFFGSDTGELPLFVRRDAFEEMGGFTTDYRVLCHDRELVSAAQLAGHRCETALLELGSIQARAPSWLQQRGYDLSASRFRAIRPELAAAPLAMRDLLLLAKGLHLRGGSGDGRRTPGADTVKKTESLLTRMMVGLTADPLPARRASPDPPVADRKGMLTMLAHFEAGDLGGGGGAQVAVPPNPPLSRALATLIEHGDIQQDGEVFGQFLGFHDGRLYGWASMPGSPDTILEIECTLGGRAARHPANHRFGSITHVPPEARNHGFVITVPSGWCSLLRQSSPEPYRLEIDRSGLILAEGMMPQRSTALSRHGIDGFCDASDNGIVYGWAWYPEDPARSVDLALFIDGIFFARVRANRDREDLRQRHIGQGQYGFNITLPKAVREQGRHRIDVVVADLGVPLVRSPMQSEGLIVGVSPPRKRKLFRR